MYILVRTWSEETSGRVQAEEEINYTLLAYLALILSSSASTLGFRKSSGEIRTRSEMVVWQ